VACDGAGCCWADNDARVRDKMNKDATGTTSNFVVGSMENSSRRQAEDMKGSARKSSLSCNENAKRCLRIGVHVPTRSRIQLFTNGYRHTEA
jgi:hypothetical protein